MSYIESSLTSGEQIRELFPPHWIVRLSIATHFLVGLLTAGLWLPVAIYVWLRWRCTEQGVTSRRVVRKHGIISRETAEMRLGAIESIVISQTVPGRLLGYGTVTVTGRGAGDVVLSWIADPVRAKREIEEAEAAATPRAVS